MIIEKTIRDHLTEKLGTVPVYIELPKDVPTKYVVIQRTGGRKENGLCSSTIAVQSIASTLYEAAQLNESVKTAMDSVTEVQDVFDCQLNSDYNFTNTTTKERRYQAVFNVYYE